MKKYKINWFQIKYELKGNLVNIYTFLFALLLPMGLSILICNNLISEIPEQFIDISKLAIIISVSGFIPLSIMFIGYATSTSKENSDDIPLRLQLFGISPKQILIGKIISYLISLIICTILFFLINYVVLGFYIPSLQAILIYTLVYLIMSIELLSLAHGIALIIVEPNKVYGISMIVYFAIMILSGNMGISVENLPVFVQKFSKLLPFYQIHSSDFLAILQDKEGSFTNILVSLIFFGILSFIVLSLGLRKLKRK